MRKILTVKELITLLLEHNMDAYVYFLMYVGEEMETEKEKKRQTK